MLQPKLRIRRDKTRVLMAQHNIDAALITCNVSLLYTYGHVISGYLYLPLHSPALLFIKRPNNIADEYVFPVQRPEQILDLIKKSGLPAPQKLMLEGGELSYTEYNRLAAVFPESEIVNETPLTREAHSIRIPAEVELFRRSDVAHAKAYKQIPSIYRPGVADLEFSVEIERLMRLQSNLGIFHVFGQSMEIFMDNMPTGDNTTFPSPCDFALGGEGLDPALPRGLNRSLLREGQSVMVDLRGNFGGCIGDISHVFSIGKLGDEAYTAHQVCLDIRDVVSLMTQSGVVCEDLYNTTIDIVAKAGFADRFMGIGQQTKFIGRGVGLKINEAPVLTLRMKQELEPGMVFALEPKIVIPGVGPIGIENSWTVTQKDVEKLTICNEEIIELQQKQIPIDTQKTTVVFFTPQPSFSYYY